MCEEESGVLLLLLLLLVALRWSEVVVCGSGMADATRHTGRPLCRERRSHARAPTLLLPLP